MSAKQEYAAIWNKCMQLSHEYIKKGEAYRQNVDGDTQSQNETEQFCLNARYLHRGFYCPSPDMEYIITNMRRGTIAKRLNSAKNITNRYVFHADGRMKIAETINLNGHISTEHIFYQNNTVWGVTFERASDMSKRVCEVSVEEYADEKIRSYLWATCNYNSNKDQYTIWQIIYEEYHYGNEGYLETDFYYMSPSSVPEWDHICQYQKYRFHLDGNGGVIPKSKEMRDKGTVCVNPFEKQ